MKSVILVITITLLLVPFQNCGTEFGDPTLSSVKEIKEDLNFKIAAYDQTLMVTTVTQLSVCLSEIEFKPDNQAQNGEKVKYEFNNVILDPMGTDLGQIDVPNGTYKNIELELDGDECLSGNTVVVTNANGTFQTNDKIEIEFEGQFTVEATSNLLELVMDNIIVALESVTEDDEIKDAIEDALGEFEEEEDSNDDD